LQRLEFPPSARCRLFRFEPRDDPIQRGQRPAAFEFPFRRCWNVRVPAKSLLRKIAIE